MELKSLLLLANALVSTSLPLTGDCHFRLCYSFVRDVKELYSLEPIYCLYFTLKYIEAPAPKVAPLPTLKSRIAAL
jgi:hypothetical protein